MKFAKCLGLFVAATALFGCHEGRVDVQADLFVTTPESVHPYRIPSIVTAKDGSLLAMADYRYGGGDVGSGRIDLHARRSTDNGRTWGEEFTAVQGDGGEGFNCAHGDAAMVVDRESGTVLLMAASGDLSYFDSRRDRPQPIGHFYSYDNGKSWSEGEDVTEAIYGLFDGSALGAVDGMFVASGKVCQSRRVKVGSHYRIYAALCARPGGNRVIYSDDFGKSWQVLGDVDVSPVPDGDEPKCEELPNGNVVISSRMRGGRFFNIYSYEDAAHGIGGKWADVAVSDAGNSGVVAVNNSCNGELLLLPVVRRCDKGHSWLALQSVPFGSDTVASGRCNVGVYYKELRDEADYTEPAALAKDWKGFAVSGMGSAYSTMTVQDDRGIGFLYEEESYGACYTIVYKRLSVEEITGGEFSFDKKCFAEYKKGH